MEIIKKQIEFSPNSRIIAISDIHGDLTKFKQLLNDVNYDEKEDYLILLGDYVNRGKENLATLRYVMSLSKNERCIALLGNHDYLTIDFYENINEDNYYFFRWNANTLLREMCNEAKINLDSDISIKTLMEKLNNIFKDEFNFIRSLPTVLESKDYIFVHSGIKDNNSNNIYDYIAIDSYNNIADKNQKYVIVGHYPSVNFYENTLNYNPLLNYSNNVFTIDGGNTIKKAGQLNALIITKDEITSKYVDDLPIYKIIKNQYVCNKDVWKLTWPKNKIEVLENQDEFCLCYSYKYDSEVYIPKEFVYEYDGDIFTKDITNFMHNVKINDEVGLLFKTKKYSLVKHKGVIGWISNKCIFKED